jgi:phage head maturation protease
MARSTVAGPGMLELREDPKGLRTYAELVPTQAAKDLRQLVQAASCRRCRSRSAIGEDGGKDVWDGEDGGSVRTIISFGGLFDVCPVVFPAYPQTDASMRHPGRRRRGC